MASVKSEPIARQMRMDMKKRYRDEVLSLENAAKMIPGRAARHTIRTARVP